MYVVAATDLPVLDIADGYRDQVVQLSYLAFGRNSWKLIGEYENEGAGRTLAAADFDSDGRLDVIVGADWTGVKGAVYLVSGADLSAADAADGAADHVIGLDRIAAQSGSWQLVGEREFTHAGGGVATIGDMDGDDRPEIAVSAPGVARATGENTYLSDMDSAIHIVASSDLAGADSADGIADGFIELSNAPSQPNSWTLIFDLHSDAALGSATDLDADGLSELLVDAFGLAWLAPTASLARAAGDADGVIRFSQVASLPGNREFTGPAGNSPIETFASSTGDLNGDGVADLSFSIWDWSPGDSLDELDVRTYLLSGADLATSDGIDGSSDGVSDLELAAASGKAWEARQLYAYAAGDVDGDGLGDIVFGPFHLVERPVFHMVHGADLGGLPKRFSDDDLNKWGEAWKFGWAGDRRWGHFPFGGNVNGGGQRPWIPRSTYIRNALPAGDVDGVRNILDPDDDGDGVEELLTGSYWSTAYLFVASVDSLSAADSADGQADGVINVDRAATLPGNWRFSGPE